MLTSLIVITIFINLFHIIYQQIIQKLLLTSVEFKLFRLRDQLRNLKLSGKITDDEFNNLEFFLCNSIAISAKFDLYTFHLVNKYGKNKKLLQKIAREGEANIKSSKNKDYKAIFQEAHQAIFRAFRINSFLASLYLLPIFIIIYLIVLLSNKHKAFNNTMGAPLFSNSLNSNILHARQAG